MAHITDRTAPPDVPTTNALAGLGVEPEVDQAYLTFGGWAKLMPAPALHERRRYTVDVECTATGVKASEKGDRHVRSLSILRVVEVKDVIVPPKDEDENQGSLFEGGDPDAQPDDDQAEDGPWPGDAEHPDTPAPPKATKAAAKKADPPNNVTQFKAPGSK